MRPTAIFANNDYAAVIAMSEAQQMGLAIPDDISVVGYDNSYLARPDFLAVRGSLLPEDERLLAGQVAAGGAFGARGGVRSARAKD